MKAMTLALVCLLLFQQDSWSQKDTAAIGSKLRAQQYTFVAQTATPLRGRFIQLTSPYDLRVSMDSVIAALPYFGRAFSATPGSTGGGIDFTSTKFDYKKEWRKKKWEITIAPHDNTDVNELFLTVFDNGKASLRVSSNNRQSITFDGYIK